MVTRFLSVLLMLLLAGCATPTVVPTSAPSQSVPAPAATATAPVEPASYSSSLLLARWDTKIRHYLLSPVDPATGGTIAGYAPVDLGVNYYHVFSANRKVLAIITYTDDSASEPVLHIIDLAYWRERSFKLENLSGWTSAIALSSDGSTLVAALLDRDNSLFVFDLKQDMISAQVQTEFNVKQLQFTQDGTGLMVYGSVLVDRSTQNERNQGPVRVALLDAHDLSPRWSAEVAGLRDGTYAMDEKNVSDLHQPGNSIYLNPGVVFAPGTDVLYAIHADEGRLTRIDFASRSIRTVSIQPRLSWFERYLMLGARTAYAKGGNGVLRQAVISPDGEVIYTIGIKNEVHLQSNGDWEFTFTPLGFQAIRSSDGSVAFEKDIYADSLSIAPDGSCLFLYSWKEGDPYGGLTNIFDLKNSEFGTQYAGVQLSPTRRMDGSLVLVSATTMPDSSEATRMAIHDYTTGGLIAEWISPTYAGWITPR